MIFHKVARSRPQDSSYVMSLSTQIRLPLNPVYNIVSSRPQDSSLVILCQVSFHAKFCFLLNPGPKAVLMQSHFLPRFVFSWTSFYQVDRPRPQDSSIVIPLSTKICLLLTTFYRCIQLQAPRLLSCSITLLPSSSFSCQNCLNVLTVYHRNGNNLVF